MERLRITLRRKKEDPLDYVKDLAEALIEGRVIREDVLFRDAVNEIYTTLRDVLFKEKRSGENIIRAYELAVILRYLVQGGVKTSREILEELVQTLE
ncbi:MAG: hypothetical protein J7K48_00910 [Thermococcus sp.]|uniref:Uncharacterized protein n=1 Tax=Thermococcus guaymasensis DSM 11113 TaxID=1432656 RepID=A0A0X1KLE4_9EURY|nr:hypothetical protein [Thermococcus guaymasensis]AJC72076.1 hypothetical protein X802_07810 [Thermococcus guaymasensis DSM 11113]MCD6523553.1 hypothetical protein [Thermococcus sp.]